MNKQNITSVIFGSSLVLIVLFEDYLGRELWIYQPIPLAISGFGCFFILLNALIKKNWQNTLIIVVSGVLTGVIYLPKSEAFKSKPVLIAILVDDLSSLSLTLREDNTFELIPETWMGVGEKFTGKYEIDGSRIVFLNSPYESAFIPDTVNIYKGKIVLNEDVNEPDTSFAQYFEIRPNLIENSVNKR